MVELVKKLQSIANLLLRTYTQRQGCKFSDLRTRERRQLWPGIHQDPKFSVRRKNHLSRLNYHEWLTIDLDVNAVLWNLVGTRLSESPCHLSSGRYPLAEALAATASTQEARVKAFLHANVHREAHHGIVPVDLNSAVLERLLRFEKLSCAFLGDVDPDFASVLPEVRAPSEARNIQELDLRHGAAKFVRTWETLE